MPRLLRRLTVLGLLCLRMQASAPSQETAPSATWEPPREVRVEWKSEDRSTLRARLSSTAAIPTDVSIPAGTVVKVGSATRLVWRAVPLRLEPGGAAEVVVPAAALTSTMDVKSASPLNLPPGVTDEPRLAGLLKFLATSKTDFAPPTIQLVVLCLTEDMTFAQWQQFLARADTARTMPTPPTPTQIVQAIDTLEILHGIAPVQRFALATDPDLKARALRNPWARAKAMQLYGLNLGDAGVPPSLGALLHTGPGDNCPICRQRTEMERATSDF